MSDFQIKKLNSVVVPVSNLETSIDFYSNTLGLTKDFIDEGMAFYSVGSGENKTTILLHIVDTPEPVEKGVVFELLVDDLMKAISSIKEKQGVVIQEPLSREWGVKEAVISDPDGYKIWIVQNLQ